MGTVFTLPARAYTLYNLFSILSLQIIIQIDREASDGLRELNGIYAEILDSSMLPF